MSVDLRNIFLADTLLSSQPYVSSGGGGGERSIPQRDVNAHAAYLTKRFQVVHEQSLTQKQVAAIRYKEGVYLEFTGAAGCDLSYKSLEDVRSGIRLLNVREDIETNTVHATIYVPAGKESHFIKTTNEYLQSFAETGKARHKDLLNSIEDVKLAILDSFWTGKKEDMPSEIPVWCEVWLRVDNRDIYPSSENQLTQTCEEIGASFSSESISFPERLVKLVQANADQLMQIISRCDYMAEIRRAQEANTFFVDLPNNDQRAWGDELLKRVVFAQSNVSVCILDTGITQAHPLIAPALPLDSVLTVQSKWGEGDHDGHGTEMAGVAIYNNLKGALLSGGQVSVVHNLESVKILPPRGENKPELYGAITQQAIYLATISNPDTKRSVCMAITSEEYNTGDGSPTSWSAGVDGITSGTLTNGERQLFFVSAGNVEPSEHKVNKYPDANIMHAVESPGQAWNAITVGAYNRNIDIAGQLPKEYKPVAIKDGLSPYSASSFLWEQKWPVKPEILCDGGNVATNGGDYTSCENLSLLTTNYRPAQRLFSTINGTSAATAQAAWMAAQIMTEYPDIWPETVRALLVHSASWTDAMKSTLCREDRKGAGRRMLLRTCGYGIPNLEKALQCIKNSVNMVIQGELQPYIKRGTGSPTMNEMHIHKLPWPTQILKDLGETEATMHVTLSYYVEPGPGEIGWKDKYRYASCGLRFDVNNTDESLKSFEKRINAKMREEKDDKGDGSSGSDKWYLGRDNRDVGSIHSDFRTQNAIDLCDMNYLAIYPVIGWWRERAYLKMYNRAVRYALVVTISTPDISTDLYTPIITQIKPEIITTIPTP